MNVESYVLVFLAYLTAALINMLVAPNLYVIWKYAPLVILNIVPTLFLMLVLSNHMVEKKINAQDVWVSVFIMNAIIASAYCNDARNNVKYDRLLNIDIFDKCSLIYISIILFPYLALLFLNTKYEGILIYISIILLYATIKRYINQII